MDMISFLTKYATEDNVSFHMPGHKGSGIFKMCGFDKVINSLVDMDITEIVGADNLYKSNGIIKDIEDRYRNIYGSKRSFILINGTSCGIVASILASVPRGKKILVSRASHKSVYSGIVLSGCQPVYIMPKIETSFDVMGEISAQDIAYELDKDEDIEAVILASPNYYGICSNIQEIAKVVHEKDKILIVDQAHGAHLKIFENILGEDNILPKSAESSGADIVINSTHKTLASFTQSALLNLMTNRVDEALLFEKLQYLQSTSPSYLLMASHNMNLEIIEKYGDTLFRQWKDNIEYIYGKLHSIKGLQILDCPNLDKTKINLSFSQLGLIGDEVEQDLLKEKIYIELVTGHILMAMSGIGNTKDDFKRLKTALEKIGKENFSKNGKIKNINKEGYKMTKAGAYVGLGKKEIQVSLEEAIGCTASKLVAPYPPGIPLICPGEEITEESVRLLLRMIEENKLIYGVSDQGKINIFED